MPKTLKDELSMVVTPTAPTTIDEAKAIGPVTAGQMVSAPLMPISGPIPGKSGDFVAGVLKNFWQSPTIKAIRNAVIGAVGLGLFGFAAQIIAVSGDFTQINWQTTQKLFIGSVAFTLASAYAAWWKNHDNDPVK
jgi:hypothetical protein